MIRFSIVLLVFSVILNSIECGMNLFALILTFYISAVTSVDIDDVKCEAQLNYFTDSLSAREAWAIECEKMLKI